MTTGIEVGTLAASAHVFKALTDLGLTPGTHLRFPAAMPSPNPARARKQAFLPLALFLAATSGACGDDSPAGRDSTHDGSTGDGDEANGNGDGDRASPGHDASSQDGDGDQDSSDSDEDAATSQLDAGSDGAMPVSTDPTDRASYGLGGTSRCAKANALLCEDFEGAKIDNATWTVNTWGSGSATLDSTRAARGSKSLHITQPSTGARVVLRETKTFATTGNHFFGRMFLYFDYVPDALNCHAACEGCQNWVCDNLIHWTVATAGGKWTDGNSTQELGVRALGAVNQDLMINLDYGSGNEVGIGDKNGPAGYQHVDQSHRNQWMCFEFEYVGQGDDAEIRVWWDGREHTALHYSKNNTGTSGDKKNPPWKIPKYEWLEFGFEHYQDYSAIVPKLDAWLDEIVVDDERIGCAR